MHFPFSSDDLKQMLGLYMRGLRILKHLTLADMAQKLGHKNSTFLFAIEQGRQAIPIDKLRDYSSRYDADRVYFPRLVLFVWHPDLWAWFKDNLERDDNWDHADEKRRWAEMYADEELMGLLIYGLFDMIFILKAKDQAKVYNFIKHVQGWRIKKPELPPHLQPDFINKCKMECEQKRLEEDAIKKMRANKRQEREERRARGELKPLKRQRERQKR